MQSISFCTKVMQRHRRKSLEASQCQGKRKKIHLMCNNHSRSSRAIKYITFSVERGFPLLCLQSPQSHDAAQNWSKVTIRIPNLNSKVIHLEAVQVYDTTLEEKSWPTASLQMGISSVNQLLPALLSALFRRE